MLVSADRFTPEGATADAGKRKAKGNGSFAELGRVPVGATTVEAALTSAAMPSGQNSAGTYLARFGGFGRSERVIDGGFLADTVSVIHSCLKGEVAAQGAKAAPEPVNSNSRRSKHDLALAHQNHPTWASVWDWVLGLVLWVWGIFESTMLTSIPRNRIGFPLVRIANALVCHNLTLDPREIMQNLTAWEPATRKEFKTVEIAIPAQWNSEKDCVATETGDTAVAV